MKKSLLILLLAAALLWAAGGCAAGKTGNAEPESAVLTLVIQNQTGVDFYELAVRYAADGEILGSMAVQRRGDKAAPSSGEFRFAFTDEQLAGRSPARFQADVFAAARAGEDHVSCGSVLIRAPKPGESFTLILSGDEGGLSLSAEDADPRLEIPAAP